VAALGAVGAVAPAGLTLVLRALAAALDALLLDAGAVALAVMGGGGGNGAEMGAAHSPQ
jgi:hypothetical protein